MKSIPVPSEASVPTAAEADRSGNGLTHSTRRRQRIRFWSMLLLAYVLSIGPMYWVWYEAVFVNGSWLVAAFYQPLRLIASLPIIGDLIEDYIYLWIVLMEWIERMLRGN